MVAHGDERCRIGALKAEDRLLGIADGEDRADRVARTPAGEKLLGQGRHDLPLVRVGILRLVDQDMIDAAIELEQHPGGDARLRQQVARREDQVVVIEETAPALEIVIDLQHGPGQPDQGTGRSGDHGGGAAGAEGHETLGFSG